MSRMRRIPLPALALLAGCATAGTSARQALLTDGPVSRDRACTVAAEPAQLPAAAELVDEQAFDAAAQKLWEGAGKPHGYVLFSVRHSPDGAQVRRAVIESSLPEPLADSLQKLVFAYRRQAPASRDEWGVRMRVDLGQPVALRIGRRESCNPQPRNWEYRTANNPFDAREQSPWGSGSAVMTDPSVVWVHVQLNERGTVTDARVERSIVRISEQTLLSYVRSMAFIPATEDGYPVPGELTLPVRLSMLN